MSKLSNGHWSFELYTQMVTTKEWKAILLEHGNDIIVNGRLRKLRGEYMGAGVYRVSKAPLKERSWT